MGNYLNIDELKKEHLGMQINWLTVIDIFRDNTTNKVMYKCQCKCGNIRIYTKKLLLSIQPKNKIVAIGDIDYTNWNTYPLTYLLDRKLVNPTVLDESKIYQSIHGMRTKDPSVIHPQMLISESVVIRIVGLDNSTNINDYINTFINMCIASDLCKIIFFIIDGDKRFYKNHVYIRKTNSSFIDISTSDKRPYQIESTPLYVSPDSITFFNYTKKNKPVQTKKTVSINTGSHGNCSSLLDDPDFI